MAKRKLYAIVKMEIVRQVDFEADGEMSNDALGDLAVEIAEKEFGECDQAEIIEMDWRE